MACLGMPHHGQLYGARTDGVLRRSGRLAGQTDLRSTPRRIWYCEMMNDEELLGALDSLKSTMIAVATGGVRIQDVKDEFARHFDVVAGELMKRGIGNPPPYRDLWDWYGRWSSGDLPTYQSRRKFVSELFNPLVARVQKRITADIEPTGWQRVDRTVTEMRSRLASANTEEQFQAVGLLCRETLNFDRSGRLRRASTSHIGRRSR